jgi:hypothetical protein
MLWRLCAIRGSCEPSGRGGRSAAIRRNRAWNSSFVARSSSLCEINLMISFVSSHGHRGLLGTEERRRRLEFQGRPWRSGVPGGPYSRRVVTPRSSFPLGVISSFSVQRRRGAFVGKVKDVDGCVLHSPKTRWGFGHPVPASLALCAPIVWVSRSGVAPEALWIKPRLEIIPPPL